MCRYVLTGSRKCNYLYCNYQFRVGNQIKFTIMKKVFFLSKGLEKFSNLEINDLDSFKGGAIYVPEEIYYPTIAYRPCKFNEVWSDKLNRCVSKLEEEKERNVVSS